MLPHPCPGFAPNLHLTLWVVVGSYANARVNGLVVDMGAAATTITPVQDGYALMMGAKRGLVCGNLLDTQLLEVLQRRDVTVQPSYCTRSYKPPTFAVHSSYKRHFTLTSIRDVKAATFRVSESPFDAAYAACRCTCASPVAFFILRLCVCPPLHPTEPTPRCLACRLSCLTAPPCTSRRSGTPCRSCFSMWTRCVPESSASKICSPPSFKVFKPVQQKHGTICWVRGVAVYYWGGGVRCCACDSRRVSSFTANVTLIGGCAETPGMAERLQKELNLIAPVLVRVVAPWLPLWLVSITHCLSLCVAVWVCIYVCVYLKGATATVVPSSHRRMAAWMGGSILASMSGFPDMWVSRAEYLESGADVFQRKCP